MAIRILVGDCREQLKTLEPQSVHCVVTSPPYWGLRDYGEDGQLGLEKTPEEHVAVMVDVFREVWRVLRDDATCWLNYGDAFKDKQLLGLPWRVAFALQADGWYLRSDIIWHKPNPMPESVTDRPTKAHEYIFLLTKKARYFYDADAVREAGEGYGRGVWAHQHFKGGDITKGHGKGVGCNAHSFEGGRNLRTVWTIPTHPFPGAHFATFPPKLVEPCIKAGTSEHGVCSVCGAPWVREVERGELVPTSKAADKRPYASPHEDGADQGVKRSATHRSKCAYENMTTGWRSTCKHDDHAGRAVVLDPFGGAGTVGLVADRLQRDAVLCELNEEYAEMARKRISGDCPMFANVTVRGGE